MFQKQYNREEKMYFLVQTVLQKENGQVLG